MYPDRGADLLPVIFRPKQNLVILCNRVYHCRKALFILSALRWCVATIYQE